MHRVVFQRSFSMGGTELILLAKGHIDIDLLEELEGFIQRQRRVLDAALPSAEDAKGILAEPTE